MVVIGIDPGVHTGVAVYIDGKLHRCESMGAHEAWALVRGLAECGPPVMVVFEDARLIGGIGGAKVGSKEAAARAQGAGSVKRDCALWAELLEELGCPYRSISPKAKGAKVGAEEFARITGWSWRTNCHGRDAAMIAWAFRNQRNV